MQITRHYKIVQAEHFRQNKCHKHIGSHYFLPNIWLPFYQRCGGVTMTDFTLHFSVLIPVLLHIVSRTFPKSFTPLIVHSCISSLTGAKVRLFPLCTALHDEYLPLPAHGRAEEDALMRPQASFAVEMGASCPRCLDAAFCCCRSR